MSDRPTTDEKITECPICGSELQGSRTEYVAGVVVDASGRVLDYDRVTGSENEVVYCEGDHTLKEILEHLANDHVGDVDDAERLLLVACLRYAEANLDELNEALLTEESATTVRQPETIEIDGSTRLPILPDELQPLLRRLGASR